MKSEEEYDALMQAFINHLNRSIDLNKRMIDFNKFIERCYIMLFSVAIFAAILSIEWYLVCKY